MAAGMTSGAVLEGVAALRAADGLADGWGPAGAALVRGRGGVTEGVGSPLLWAALELLINTTSKARQGTPKRLRAITPAFSSLGPPAEVLLE